MWLLSRQVRCHMSYITWGQSKQTWTLGSVPFWPAPLLIPVPLPTLGQNAFLFLFFPPLRILMLSFLGFSQSIVFSFFSSLLTFWIMYRRLLSLSWKLILTYYFHLYTVKWRWGPIQVNHVRGNITGEVLWLQEQREDSPGSGREDFVGYQQWRVNIQGTVRSGALRQTASFEPISSVAIYRP